MYIISDVHGKFDQYFNIIKKLPGPSIQLGDMGIGFNGFDPQEWDKDHVFFPGNHDNRDKCLKHPNCIGDFGVYKRYFFVSGAYSVDKNLRTPGIDWWDNEQLSQHQLDDAYTLYCVIKPDIMVTHDLPFSLCNSAKEIAVASDPRNAGWGSVKETRTTHMLEKMLKEHRPKIWVAGHWHISSNIEIDGTEFIMLPELGVLEIIYNKKIRGIMTRKVVIDNPLSFLHY